MLEFMIDCKVVNIYHNSIRNVHFYLMFNDHLANTNNLTQVFNINRQQLLDLCQKVLDELSNRNMLNTHRISTQISNEIFEQLRDDPSIQILADCIPLQLFHSLAPLIRTTLSGPTLSVYLSLHA